MTKEQIDEEIDKMCEADWGGDTFVTLDETWDGENEGTTQSVNTEKIKEFIHKTIEQVEKDAYEKGKEQTLEEVEKKIEERKDTIPNILGQEYYPATDRNETFDEILQTIKEMKK